MKKRIPTFVAGMVTMALIGSIGFTALATTGQLTITVDPVNIQVNGATFAPTDAKGNSVPVFALNGTTYAPLRALAEAYGLEVGYDKGSNMATVGEKGTIPTPTTEPTTPVDPNRVPDITVDELKAMFKFDETFELNGNNDYLFMYCGDRAIDEFNEWWGALNKDDIKVAITSWAKDFYTTEYTGDKPISIGLYNKSAMGTTMLYARIYYNPIDGASNFRLNWNYSK